ncbi:MAG: hypothetical protein WCV73_03545 [Patescibacteria group bacterium]|jgi:hypothetical protein
MLQVIMALAFMVSAFVQSSEAQTSDNAIFGNYAGAGLHRLYHIYPTSYIDGGHICAGMDTTVGLGRDGWIAKIDENGKIQWERSYGGVRNDYLKFVAICDDTSGKPTGYVATGLTRSFSVDEIGKIWLIRVDLDGNELWSKSYDLPGEASGVSCAYTGQGWIILGKYLKFPGSKIWITVMIEVDENGKLLNRKSWSR